MDEHATREASVPRSERTDEILRYVIIGLFAVVLGAGAFFGYTIWKTSQDEANSTPAQRALVTLERAVRRDPDHAGARVRYGEALASAGLFDEATEQFKAAVKIDENHTGAWLDLGLVAMQVDQRLQAEKYFEKVVDLTNGAQYENIDQRRETALFHLGEIALDDKRFEDAAGYFKASLRIRKDASDTYYLLAQSLYGLESYDGALEQLDAALAFDPNYPEAHFLYGTILMDRGDRVNAAVHLRTAATLAPDVKQAQEALEELGTADAAIDRSEKALAAGDSKKAVEEALLARALEPQNVDAGLAHAAAVIKLGDKKAAKAVLQEVLELEATNAEAKKLLASLGE